MLSDMRNLFDHHSFPRRSLLLWRAWLRALQPLRPACSRTSTFLWLVLVLAALCLRPDLAGVTSLVRALGLSDLSYYCLLHFFHSPALHLDRLTQLWRQSLQHLFRRHLVRVNGRPVVLVDGLKRPKEGRKMPAVKSLHQESRCNAKASFIMGHSLQAVALLVHAAGVCLAVPVTARIHEGVVWSARDRRTLLDKLGTLLLGLQWDCTLTVVADAYYAAAKFARCLWAKATTWSRAFVPTPWPIFRPPAVSYADAVAVPGFTATRRTSRVGSATGRTSSKRPVQSMANRASPCATTATICCGAPWANWYASCGSAIPPAGTWFSCVPT